MRTRILLQGALAAMALTLVMAASANAANLTPNISPTGTFTATTSNLKITYPATTKHSEGATINCKSSTFSGLVHVSEGPGNAVTGYEPPTFKECEVRDYIYSGVAGTAKITATLPIAKFVVGLYEPGLQFGLSLPVLHVRTEQPLGVDCEFEIRGTMRYYTTQGYAPIVLSELAISGANTLVPYVKNAGICKEMFGESDASVAGTYRLNHTLTVSS